MKLFLEEFGSFLEKLVTSTGPLMITGDFNFHLNVPSDCVAARFGRSLEVFILIQHVTLLFIRMAISLTYIHHHFSGAPRGAFQQPVYNKCKVRWLRVLARPLKAVHNVFLSETLSCALS